MTCAACQLPLRLSLFPGEGSSAWCRSCGQAADYGDLIRSGIPSGLIVRLMEWEKEFSRITGIGVGGDYGPGLNDLQYAQAWRELFAESRTLVSDLGWHLPVHSAAIDEVFGGGTPGDATDEQITRWRRRTQRLELVGSYGWLLGLRPRDPAATPLAPDPGLLRSDEETQHFRQAFEIAGRSGVPMNLQESTWRSLLSDLERQLAATP